MRRAGLPVEHARGGVVLADMNLVHAAALASQGIAMGDEFICHHDMEDGRLQQLAAPRAIYERPANRFVAEFLGDINLLPLTGLAGSTPSSPATPGPASRWRMR